MINKGDIRVLVIDDSAYNRRVLSEMLSSEPGIVVVGKACDGEEGLQLAISQKPDVITLDLEMPRMDGFALLRILMAKRPIPVIVISAYAEKEKVFRALELGALDFVAKPTARISPSIQEIRREVIKKVKLARALRPDSICPASAYYPIEDTPPPKTRTKKQESSGRKPGPNLKAAARSAMPSYGTAAAPRKETRSRSVVALAASTGGPTSLTRILTTFSEDIDAAIIVVQHMPPRFTTTFAERLNRQCAIRVTEVTGEEPLLGGVAYVASGDACLEVRPDDNGLIVSAVPPAPGDRYVPSASRLFSSLAGVAGKDALAVVLTGMGDDGSSGASDIAAAGGTVVAESESTAVVFGMPKAAIDTGLVTHVAPLYKIPAIIGEFIDM
ncbi:MAG: chemotaxis-specific protein-glutamate methyltransferase CheB [Deltaproteobacteria bacterium]|nr:chemotaxis-specific protein-glutamate methyltransferase CheB [Deltaproteobacteria bacterium]